MKNIRLVVNNEFKKKEKEKFFVKKELQCILNLYAKMVSNGSWKDYSLSSGIRYKRNKTYLFLAYKHSTLRANQSFQIRYIEEFQKFSSQIIYSSKKYRDELLFLFELEIKPFMLAMAWNQSTENIGFELNFIKNSYQCGLAFRYHPILGFSKALSIAFLL